METRHRPNSIRGQKFLFIEHVFENPTKLFLIRYR